ncbi:nitroreductase family protein [Saccharibacillus sp. CPCC 101409]|uniref:nitroreductase family protein n=1 Tax=Saccharibacillus sp. CPCC 101409 TaxID=3058041 RepID=UPI0026724C31|nr:nitroreductase family protein [Saccharibacillus sp. CPCC 101409]MDO3411712.1 nitroreductase family protein [Saccharibacillus sp. CPCC 101409]
MAKEFFEALKSRRSIYGIDKNTSVDEAKIQEIVEEAVKYTPTSFNSQTSRAVILFGEQHDKLWDITLDELKKVAVSDEAFEATTGKINSFKSGYGTILFFEDQEIVQNLQNQFALYADNFPIWADQSSGMLQLVVWTALSSEGLGASLQHYNPLIDAGVQAAWNIPSTWKLRAQLPFGQPTVEAGEKAFQPLEERVKVFK